MEPTNKGTNKGKDERTKEQSNDGQRQGNRQRFRGHREPIRGKGGGVKFVKTIKGISTLKVP